MFLQYSRETITTTPRFEVTKEISTSSRIRAITQNSAASNQSHHPSESTHSRRSNLFSPSSKSKLIKAKTSGVAALDAEAAFLKEHQTLKMAEEQLELKESLA